MSTFDFTSVFQEAEEAGFGPTSKVSEPGTFEARISAARGDGSSKAGDPQLGFKFNLVDGTRYPSGADASGDEIWHNLTFSEKGGKYAAADAAALGLSAAMLNTDRREAVKVAVGQLWRIEVVENGDWLNVRLKKRLDEPARAATPEVRTTEPEAKVVEPIEGVTWEI